MSVCVCVCVFTYCGAIYVIITNDIMMLTCGLYFDNA